jgi:hypothetical protein
MTAGRNMVVPTANKVYLVKNSTTGGFAVTVKTAAGSGVTVPATTARWVYCDGTNVVDGMSGPWSPSANDAQALGLSGAAWADLFLASGGVINWNAGDVTVTHSANTLAFAGASSGYTFDAVISGTTASFTGVTLTSTDAGAAAAPIFELYRNSATPAANNILGQMLFNGEDSAGNTQEYASVQAVIVDPTSTTEDGALDVYTVVAGTRAVRASVGAGVYLSGATGGDQGTGTVNATAAYKNGVEITPIIIGAAVATTSGTAHTVTGIPSWAKRVKILLMGVSTTGTSLPMVQIGSSGGLKITGYLSGASNLTTGVSSSNATTGFIIDGNGIAGNIRSGAVVLDLADPSDNTWVVSGTLGLSDTAGTKTFGGHATLSAVLDRVSLTTVGGSETFDAGKINVSYE